MGFSYKPNEIKTISDGVIEGMLDGMSLRKACVAAGVPISTFLRWCDNDATLAEQYTCAREELIQGLFEDLVEIADAPVGTTDNGATDSGAVAKQRLQVDTRKWALSKLAPKKYGDKIETTLLGNGPGGAIVVNASINGVAVGNKPRP